MVMTDQVTVNGIDVTSYRTAWAFSSEWQESIDSAVIVFAPSVNNIQKMEVGLSVQIKRGYVTATDEFVFDGQVTQVAPSVTEIKITCKNRLYDAIKSARTKSWDKDIDTSVGIGSEIFKDICTHSQLSFTPAAGVLTNGSIYYTGNGTYDVITKFIQNDEDDYQKMNDIANIYNYIVTYDYANGYVNFKPKGYTVYPIDLRVGTEIPGQIKWKENMEQLINQIKVQGATVYDKMVETFAGPATEFTLTRTPEDTEVRINSTTTNDLQKRGQKNIGTIGTDFNYYVDVEKKKIVFSGAVSNVWINYGAQVPLPLILSNLTSINKYGGPNKIPHFSKVAYTDIKDIADAENRGRAILDKYSIPFLEAEGVPVLDSVIQTNGVISPGVMLNIIDSFNNITVTVFVKEVEKSWPHVYDKITIGDQIWRTEDWQTNQMKKINLLFNELNKNQDILYQTFDFNRDITYERRYMKLQKTDLTAFDGVIFDNVLFGGFDDVNFGFDGTGDVTTTTKIVQGSNTYKEFVYDNDFKGSCTATWNTTTKELTFTSGQIILTLPIAVGTTYRFFTINLGSTTGTITTEISGNNGSNWQTVTLGNRTLFSVADTTGVLLRFTESAASTASIINTYNSDGSYNQPAIKCLLEE